MSEEILRLRAKRAGNRGVVAKLMGKVETILEASPQELDAKTRDQLQRIDSMLSEKFTLLNTLNDQIIAVWKVEEIEKERNKRNGNIKNAHHGYESEHFKEDNASCNESRSW